MTKSWDRDSDAIQVNVASAAFLARDAADRRAPLTMELVCKWHLVMMDGLEPDRPEDRQVLDGVDWRGKCRGSSTDLALGVEVCGRPGSHHDEVAHEVENFMAAAGEFIGELDSRIGPGGAESKRQVRDVLRLAAWAHAEWVRIHPFVNGNGRSARILVLFLTRRYGLPGFLPVRPRPRGAYESASAEAMHGQWQATFAVFEDMLHRLPPPLRE